ncbi:carbohydrate ABC transporter permease [Streptomyces sp. NPDC055400]
MISKREKIFNYVILTLLTVAVLFPVAWILGVAVSPDISGHLDLGHLQWSNFTEAWRQADFTQYLKSSVIITGTAVAVSTVLAILSGYAFGVLGVAGEKLLFPLILFGVMIPMEAIIVPLYYDFQYAGVTDTYQGIILAHVGTGVSFGAFWMRAAFRSVPAGIGESAQMDGANTWTMLWRIYLPVVRPAVSTFVLLNFMWTWNDYFLSLILVSDPSHQPLTLGLGAFSGRYLVHINLLAAAAVLICLPVVGLYVFCQRQFIRGMLSGAVKG